MTSLYIGWDVGAWYCKKGKSQDAVCVLSGDSLLGLTTEVRPFVGNLSQSIYDCSDPIDALGLSPDLKGRRTVLAIDTPLGWPLEFLNLVGQRRIPTGENLPRFRRNELLFRRTEVLLGETGFEPMSAVQDQLGSQSTKGLYFLKSCGFEPTGRPGLWARGEMSAIETYPAIAYSSLAVREALQQLWQSPWYDEVRCANFMAKDDAEDATLCAIVGAMFSLNDERLEFPPILMPEASEGWIYLPIERNAQEVKKKPKKPVKARVEAGQ